MCGEPGSPTQPEGGFRSQHSLLLLDWKEKGQVLAFRTFLSQPREVRLLHRTIQEHHGWPQNQCNFVEQRFCCGLGGGEIRVAG